LFIFQNIAPGIFAVRLKRLAVRFYFSPMRLAFGSAVIIAADTSINRDAKYSYFETFLQVIAS